MENTYIAYGYKFLNRKMSAFEKMAASMHEDISFEDAVKIVKENFDCIPSSIIRLTALLPAPPTPITKILAAASPSFVLISSKFHSSLIYFLSDTSP